MIRFLMVLCIAMHLGAVAAQTYPSKPIRLVVGYGPGGVADITARLVAQKLTESMGQPVIVENRPSAGGIMAGDLVAKADPDGYTLLHLNSGNAISAASFRKLPFDVKKDFETIANMGAVDFVVLVDKSSDIKTMADFVAKARANPGKTNIGTVSIGSGQHMAATLFKSITGVDAPVVPYKATPALFAALKGKDIDVVFEVVSPALSLIRGGELRAIAVSSGKRFAGLPDVPTMMESGVKDFDVNAWNGLAAPAKTPKAIIDRLNKEVNAVLALPDVQKRFQDLGIDPRGGTPAELRNKLYSEVDKWTSLVSTMNMERQ
jgi:tripartite-type tricarboxylate transporter receptor subunit TctC